MNLDKVICINLKSDESQLLSISRKYVVDFNFLITLKSKYERVWVENDFIFNGSFCTRVIASKSIDGVVFSQSADILSDELKLKVISISPVKTPKLSKEIVTESFVDKMVSFDSDSLLDKISACGVSSLTKEELDFLSKI